MPLSGKLQPPQKQYIKLSSFSRGMNVAASPAAVPEGEAVLLQNWTLSEDGSLLPRRGTQQWATTLGAGAVSVAYRAFLNGAAFWLAVFSGTLYQTSGSAASGNTFTSAAIPVGATLTASKPTWFTQYLTFAYLSTTVDVPIKSSNGTTWTIMGVAAPSAAPTGAATTGGSLATGTSYTFEISYSSATLEGQPSAASSTVTLTGAQNAVSLTFPASSTNAAITGINVYGFETGVSNTYQQITTGLTASATGYLVTAVQSNWSTTAPATGHATPVVGPYLMRAWKSRMWKSGDPNNTARVYFSDIFIPESWPAANNFDIPFEAGDSVTSLFPLGDILFIFGNYSIYYVIGDTPFSFVVKQSFAQGGVAGPFATDRIENTIVYQSNFAIKAFDGSTERSLSDKLDPYFTGVLSSVYSPLNQAAAKNSTLVYYDQLKALVYSFPSGSGTKNDTTFWYFLKTQGWVQDTRASALLLDDRSPGGSGHLYSWDTGNGIIRQWDVDSTYTDDGSAIVAKITTGILIPSENPQRWGWLRVYAQPSNNTVNITGLVDGGADTDTISLNFASQGGGIYGTSVYGTGTYAASLATFDEHWNDTLVGRTMQLQFSITYSTFFRVVQMVQETLALPRVRFYGSNP